MRIYDIITNKRYGKILTREEIYFAVNGFVDGTIADYQMSALLMAICCKGFNEQETFDLTEVMLHSGDIIDLSAFDNLTVDKHSTGGVGDKTSLIISPIVASLGGKVAKLSGRGLAHTGGTIDKLESIAGFNVNLTKEQFFTQVKDIGMAIISPTENIVPADKKIYALRDATATVDCIPLIAASIMSKKLASGSKNIVLDVKYGNGAFMKDEAEAIKLANVMVKIGNYFNRKTTAVITDMNKPLGSAIGNKLEIQEAIEILKNNKHNNLRDVCVVLATEMISQLPLEFENPREKVEDALKTGKAYEKFKEWIIAQGGDITDTKSINGSKYKIEIKSTKEGFLHSISAIDIGTLALSLGAGRNKKEDNIDYDAGIILKKQCGDFVENGETLCTLYTNKDEFTKIKNSEFMHIFEISETAPEKQNPICATIK